MERTKNFFEAKTVDYPTLFICLGVSGAGLTTAVNQLIKERLVQPAPPQFVTRSLRANEKRGDQFYPVTKNILEKITQQIAFQDTFYDNEYGFFKPAIKKIERILDSNRNVIADVCNNPSDYENIINHKYPVTSLFFAPRHPSICVDRIQTRAKELGERLTDENLLIRKKDNAKNISKIFQYDYWVDTTDLNNVFPSLKSIVEVHSFQSDQKEIEKYLVRNNTFEIKELIKAFSG